MQIREVVQQVLSSGFLSIEAEDQLRHIRSGGFPSLHAVAKCGDDRLGAAGVPLASVLPGGGLDSGGSLNPRSKNPPQIPESMAI
jgi:hypothetical protein